MSTHPRRRLALALTLTAAVLLGAATPASAGRGPKPRPPKPPAFLLESTATWRTHDVGWFEVVNGPAEVHLGRRTLTGTLAASIQPDDYTMPAPGECEPGMVFVHVEGRGRQVDTFLSSIGDVCGHFVQAPTSVVVTSFTGTATIEESGRRRLEGTEAFLDIRLSEDGGAYVFATT